MTKRSKNLSKSSNMIMNKKKLSKFLIYLEEVILTNVLSVVIYMLLEIVVELIKNLDVQEVMVPVVIC